MRPFSVICSRLMLLRRRPRHEVVPNYYYDGNLHMVHHDAADANNSMF